MANITCVVDGAQSSLADPSSLATNIFTALSVLAGIALKLFLHFAQKKHINEVHETSRETLRQITPPASASSGLGDSSAGISNAGAEFPEDLQPRRVRAVRKSG